MPNKHYSVQRTQPRDRATSHHERVLSAQAWPFLIIEESGKTRKVIMAVASDGMPPTHARSAAWAERVVGLLNGEGL